ncbi:MAG TPA: hypothetical protein VD973_00925, partial [Symbiobacteriaceae bacterium]|nr:hypothetical protein [Symbiobacteriaceae bacterium]
MTVWEEKRPIIMLLAALSEAGERCNDGWEMEPLVCVPTQAGGWRSHDTLMRLPSEWNLLGQERELADRLRQLAGSPEGLLQWELWQEVTTPTRDAAEMTQRNWARRYLEQIAQFGLESLVERLWQQLPEEPDAQQALDVLRLTWWVRKAQPNRKRYIQRLLCRTTNGRLRLLPPGQCLLAEPYGGAYRRVLFPDLPTVIADYLDDDPDVLSSEGDWSSFFAGLEPRPAGAFTLAYQIETYKYYELHAIGIMPPSTRASAYTVEHPIAGRLNNRQYKLIDAALPIGWPVGDPLDYDQAVAAVKWLRAAQAQLQRFNQLRLAYIPLGWSEAGEDRIESAIRRPLWVEQLQDQAWVPVRRIREVCLPVDVLTADDPARPEAPVADLPPDLIAVLTAVGITFGSNIARAPVVVRLAVEGPVAAPDELLSLLTDAVTTTETDPPARTQLLKLLLTTPLFPVAPDRTGERRKHGRFVLAAGRGSQRSDLGGWLTAIADFAPESPERAVLDMVHALIPFPAQTTGAQALAYLEDVWAAPPDADTVRRLLPMAYQYVLSDMIDDTDLHTRWNAVRTGAKAFVKQQGWLPVSEVYLNDLQGLSLPADVLAGYPCASPGHFGDTLEHRRWVARALGVRLLGEQITPLYDVGSVSLGLHHIRESLRAVRELVSAVRRLSRIQEDGTDENEAPGAADEYLALPVVYQASRLELTVSVGDEVRLRRRLSAILKDGSIYVTGRSHRYAGDLTAILVQLWRLSQRGELVAKIGPLLSLIDQPAIFQEELTVLLVSLGLAGEAAVEETAAGGGVQR